MKALCLLSGGIDSPAAAYMMSRSGFEVALLYMDNFGSGDSGEKRKVIKIARTLSEDSGRKMDLYLCPYWKHQELISRLCKRNLHCVLCKKYMLMIAQELTKRIGGEVIVTGDSLGQVASQTLQNLRTVQHGLELPVLRPLIGLDKLEIEAIAREAGTFEISIEKSQPCPYVPSRPATATTPQVLEKEVKKLPGEAVMELVASIEKVTL